MKWIFSNVVAGAARGSDGTSAIKVATKSAIAASGASLDQYLTPATCLAAATSITLPATLLQMFSVPAWKNSDGWLGSTGIVEPRP